MDHGTDAGDTQRRGARDLAVTLPEEGGVGERPGYWDGAVGDGVSRGARLADATGRLRNGRWTVSSPLPAAAQPLANSSAALHRLTARAAATLGAIGCFQRDADSSRQVEAAEYSRVDYFPFLANARESRRQPLL